MIGTTGTAPDASTSRRPRVADRERQPAAGAAARRSTACSTQVQTQAKKGTPEAYYLFTKTVKKKVTTKVKGKKVTKHEDRRRPRAPAGAGRRTGSSCCCRTEREAAAGHAGAEGARRHRSPSRCRPRRTAASAPARTASRRAARTGTCSSTTRTATDGPPGADGQRPRRVGHRRRRRPEDRPADRDAPVHGPRLGAQFQKITEARVQPRPDQRGPGRPAERDTTSNTIATYAGHNAIVLDGAAPVDAVHRLHGHDPLDGIAGERPDHRSRSRSATAKQLALVLQSGSLPYTLHADRAHGRLGDARQELAPPGAPGRRHRPLVVALFLLVLYRFLGLVAVVGLAIYAAPLLRGDPALQRDADAAGLRRPDPHDRRRGRRERRRVRTHQGRGARRAIGARGDRGRLRQGLPHDSRRERRDRDHGAGPLPDRGRGREGLRPDAADRHGDLAAHRGRRDARDARPAQRLPLVRQPALHGRGGPADGEVAPDRLHGEAQPVVRDLGRDHPRRRDLARRAAASTSGSTSRAARSSRSRRTSRTRHGEVQRFMASQGQPDAVVQGSGKPSTATIKDWQVRTKSLDGRRADEPASRRSRATSARFQTGVEERLRDVRPPDRDRRDLRDHRLAAPDHDLHRDQVRLQVRDPGDPRDAARHSHHRRGLLARRARRSPSPRWPRC